MDDEHPLPTAISRSGSKSRIWTHLPLSASAVAILAELGTVETRAIRPGENWCAEAGTFDAILVGGATFVTGAVMDCIGPRLRLLAREGIGVDRIDLNAATERGIMVVNTPDGPTESTAEHAVALMLGLSKMVTFTDRILRSGAGFPVYGSLPPGLELRGATLGLVGLGRIGGRVAEIARALGMRVVAFDPLVAPGRAEALGVELIESLATLLGMSDVVSLHCPSIPETRHLINADTLAQMRPGSYLVNVARGAVIDENALVEALTSGHLAGAGLDVYDPEPPAPDHPLFSLPNTICTPHVSSYTAASLIRMQMMVVEQIVQALSGQRPTNLVNPDVWERRRTVGV